MKPLPFKIPKDSKSAIHVEHDRLKHFYSAYHIHSELQLILILKGNGLAYIGDQIQDFETGDIYLLGQNLPHVFKDKDSQGVESISIFFLPDFIGQDFLNLGEAKPILRLFKLSELGMKLLPNSNNTVKELITLMPKLDGLQQLLSFLNILSLLANFEPKVQIAGPGYSSPRRSEDGQRMNTVFDYIMDHYYENIKLKDIADVANLSPTAFCRYFKDRTRKTFSRYLNEIRIGQACKLLSESSSSISQICYITGFQNLSNFNRQFKKITGLTPREYKLMKI